MDINENHKQKKFFYGWVIVAVCLLIQAIPFGVASNLPPTFINYVVKAEGFSYASFSLMFTVGTIISAICSPFIGKLFTKVSAKTLYIIGSILVGVGFMAFSFAGNYLIAYYILAGVVQVGVAIVSSIGVPTLINAWFKVNKGTAMGIAFAGGGLGNIFLQMIAGRWLSDPAIGYKGAYIRFGAIALVVSLILSIFFVRMPKSKEELENILDPKNLQNLINSALESGLFTDLEGNIYNLKDVMLDFVDEYEDGLSSIGALIKSELVENLNLAKDTMKNLAGILGQLGISGFSSTSYANRIAELDYSSARYSNSSNNPIRGAIKKVKSKQDNQVTVQFNQPLCVIQGNVDNNLMPEIERMIRKAQEQVVKNIASAIR